MKETELRIGNIIKVWRFIKSNEPKQLMEYPIEQIGKDENLNDYYVVVGGGFAVNVSTGIEPILLTEEWLLKFGLFGWTNNMLVRKMPHSEKYEVLVRNGLQQDVIVFWNLEYVHTLQNIYPAYSNGKELTMNK